MTAEAQDPSGAEDTPLTPDLLVPEQLVAATAVEKAPERRLVGAILEDALRCFQNHLFATDAHNRHLYADAEEWFASLDRRAFFSFEHVCDVLGLDAGSVRNRLWRWRDAQRSARSEVAASRSPTARRRREPAGNGNIDDPDDHRQVA